MSSMYPRQQTDDDGVVASTEAEAVAGLAFSASVGIGLDPGEVRGFILPDGHTFHVHDAEELGEAPRRKRGTVEVLEAESFGAYAQAHVTSQTTLYGDRAHSRIVAVFNDHEPGTGSEAGWSDHRCVWPLVHSDQWKAWTAKAGHWLGQDDFANHIEDNAADIVDPAAADMLEVAQTLQANTNVSFRSQRRLHDGQTQLTYAEDVDARAGSSGQLEVPTRFVIGIPVYDGLDPYRIEARFRFRTSSGKLTVMYRLDRQADVLHHAFEEAWEAALSQTGDVPLAVLGAPHTGR